MTTIYKFPLRVTDIQELELPKGARLLTVQAQRGTPCLWAVVDDQEAEVEYWRILTFGTGNPMLADAQYSYVSTYQLMDGDLIFHVFARKMS